LADTVEGDEDLGGVFWRGFGAAIAIAMHNCKANIKRVNDIFNPQEARF
jgi:hypothetical protein